MTNEDKRAYQRAYYAANKEKILEKKRKYGVSYRANNKGKIKAKSVRQYQSKKHKPLVYILPFENYVGTTENLYHRISKHKNQSKRNTDDYRVLARFDSREEALELEEFLHDLGYLGRHPKGFYK